MLIYSGEFFAPSDGDGYSFSERDAICSNCHKVIDRQVKYKDLDKNFRMSTNDKKDWRFCPYCRTKLVETVDER